ncbi:hypothetical protein HMPREF0693_0677 [Proteus mirabilis ATCC 29906]|nr:hypothetical protein HMPREF0693_0677 [Proteus mirabilis ATCC 29906]
MGAIQLPTIISTHTISFYSACCAFCCGNFGNSLFRVVSKKKADIITKILPDDKSIDLDYMIHLFKDLLIPK